MTAVLKATNIQVSFGGVRAVDGVDLEVREGQLVGLIGPNGAGKTAFIDAITGFVPSRGTTVLHGEDLSGMAPNGRARRGLARTWQSIELFDDLSIGENLAVSAYRPGLWQSLKEIVWKPLPPSSAAHDALTLLGIEDMVDANPSDLPQGRRQLAGVARALSANPQVLLLDEPAGGLDTAESQDLGARLRKLVDGGLPMLLIDHDMGLVLNICDYIVAVDFGKVIARGTPEEIRKNPAVIAAYLGKSAAEFVGGEA